MSSPSVGDVSSSAACSASLSPQAPPIAFVLFDLAGTTVDDCVEGVPLVTHVFQRTFASAPYHVQVTPADVTPLRGRKKQEMCAKLVELKWDQIQKADPAAAAATPADVSATLFQLFERLLSETIATMATREMPGTSAVFQWLHARGVKIGVGSGFSEEVVKRLVKQLGWQEEGVGFQLAFIGGAEQGGRGRPDPSMIHSAMKQLGVTDPRRVLKVGDTTVDVEEGRNAGCITIAVLSGTQTRDELEQAKPDLVLQSIADLPTSWEELAALEGWKLRVELY